MTSPGSPAAVIAYLATAIVELSGRGGRPSGVELLAILDSVAEDISKSVRLQNTREPDLFTDRAQSSQRDSVARNLATTTADGTSKVSTCPKQVCDR